MVKVTLAASAVSDLDEVLEYDRDQGVTDVGQRLVSDILQAIDRLRAFPDSGRIVPEFDVAVLREVINPPFRIVYRRDADRVRVVRVWRSERLLELPD